MASKTKEDLVSKVAQDTGITKAQAKQAVESFLDSVSEGLAGGGKVTLTGFGTFQVQEREARTGRNPQTGEKMLIPARKVPKFSPGKNLKKLVS